MKLIDADKGYEVLDGLFSAIQKNNYAVTQQMLDETWKKWCGIPVAYDADKVVEQLETCKQIMLSPVIRDCYGEECKVGDCLVCAFEKAIEIVKAGGTNE